MLGSDSRVGPPPPSVIETEVDGDISLYDPNRETVVVLNRTASDVWRLADGEHTVDELVGLLASAYGTSPEAIRGEVEETLRSLVESGMLPGATG